MAVALTGTRVFPNGVILLAMNMSCTLFGLTPAEALAGTTRNAARALDLRIVALSPQENVPIWQYGMCLNLQNLVIVLA